MIVELLIWSAATMITSERLYDNENAEWWAKARIMLRQDEGVRYFPYRDTTGHLTIGVGRNLEAKPLSISIVRSMLDEDITAAITSACNIFGQDTFDSWSGPRQHAIVNMIFNLGETGFRRFHSTIEAIKLGEWDTAAKHALASKWAKQVKSRAHRIVELMVNEKYIYAGI